MSSSNDLIEQTVIDKPMLTRAEVSECTGIGVQSLASLAYKKQGPAFVKLGRRAIRYPRLGVIKWMRKNEFNPDSL